MQNISYNILIVEDEWMNAEYIKKIVETLGHSVVSVVGNGPDALEIASTNSLDLVLMDINLDGKMDGIECGHKLNENTAVPIVYISAYSDSNTIEDASYSNIYGFIAKPFTEKDIELTLNVAIARIRRSSREIIQKSEKIALGNNYTFNLETKSLIYTNHLIKLTKTETNFLYLLALNIGEVVKIEEIHSFLWNGDYKSASTLRNLVARVRKKIPLIYIDTFHGYGYKISI